MEGPGCFFSDQVGKAGAWQHTGSWVLCTGGPWCPRKQGPSGLAQQPTQEVPLKNRTALKGMAGWEGLVLQVEASWSLQRALASLAQGSMGSSVLGRRGLVDDAPDDKIFLDLGFLEPRAVCAELSPEKNHRCQMARCPGCCLLSCPTVRAGWH